VRPGSRRQRGRCLEMTEENEEEVKHYKIVYQNDDVIVMFRVYPEEEE